MHHAHEQHVHTQYFRQKNENAVRKMTDARPARREDPDRRPWLFLIAEGTTPEQFIIDPFSPNSDALPDFILKAIVESVVLAKKTADVMRSWGFRGGGIERARSLCESILTKQLGHPCEVITQDELQRRVRDGEIQVRLLSYAEVAKKNIRLVRAQRRWAKK